MVSLKKGGGNVFFLYTVSCGYFIICIAILYGLFGNLSNNLIIQKLLDGLAYILVLISVFLILKSLKPSVYSDLISSLLEWKRKDTIQALLIIITFASINIILVLLGIKVDILDYKVIGFDENKTIYIVLLYLASSILTWFCVSFTEEIIFRALLLKHTLTKIGVLPATTVNIIIFTGLHSPNFTSITILITVLIGDIITCILFLRTKRIYSVIAFHFIWNFIAFYVLNYYDINNYNIVFVHPSKSVETVSNLDLVALIYIISALIFLLFIPYITKKNPTFIEPPPNA